MMRNIVLTLTALLFSMWLLPVSDAGAQSGFARRYVLLVVSVSPGGEQRPIPCENCSFQTPEQCEKQAEKLRKDFQIFGAKVATSCIDRGMQ